MCAGKVKVLGECYKTVGWYMGNSSATVGRYFNRYGGYCCMCHGENIVICALIMLVNLILFM
jgi:hypothetical protein